MQQNKSISISDGKNYFNYEKKNDYLETASVKCIVFIMSVNKKAYT